MPINWPLGLGTQFKGVYDRRTQMVHVFERSDVRGKGVGEAQRPSAIEREAERADAHVGRVKPAPAELLDVGR